MKVLVACEESQAVTVEMRKLGHEAYSCDILPCSGGHPEWHVMGDVLPLLDGNCTFKTMDGKVTYIPGGVGFDSCVPALHIPFQCRGLPAVPEEGAT